MKFYPSQFKRSEDNAIYLFSFEDLGIEYKYYRCKSSGIIFDLPFSSESDLTDYYNGYGNYLDKSRIDEGLGKDSNYYKSVSAKADWIKNKLKINNPKLLEVGCNCGIHMKHFADFGYDVYGQDVDPQTTAIAKKLHTPDKIYCGQLGDSSFIDGSFDFVFCEQTIEHVLDPHLLLQQICGALKQGGGLMISTPNFAGPSFNILRENWRYVFPNDHITMFSLECLESFLVDTGFKIIDSRARGLSLNVRRNGRFNYEIQMNDITPILNILNITADHMKMGDNCSIFAIKK